VESTCRAGVAVLAKRANSSKDGLESLERGGCSASGL